MLVNFSEKALWDPCGRPEHLRQHHPVNSDKQQRPRVCKQSRDSFGIMRTKNGNRIQKSTLFADIFDSKNFKRLSSNLRPNRWLTWLRRFYSWRRCGHATSRLCRRQLRSCKRISEGWLNSAETASIFQISAINIVCFEAARGDKSTSHLSRASANISCTALLIVKYRIVLN